MPEETNPMDIAPAVNQPRMVMLDSRDAANLVLMERLCFTCPWSEEQLRAAFGLREFKVLGLREGGNQDSKAQRGLLGYLSFYHLPPEMEILNLAVHPFHRRQGLGAGLLGHALQWAEKRGIHYVHLEVRVSNTAARNLYAAHGFTHMGTRKNYYPDTREDALVMRRHLTGAASPPAAADAPGHPQGDGTQ
jgi:ribosomal-protein-alanine N-acetyltransferase